MWYKLADVSVLTSVEISVAVAPALRLVVECTVTVLVIGTSFVSVAVEIEVETLFTCQRNCTNPPKYFSMNLMLSRKKNAREELRMGTVL